MSDATLDTQLLEADDQGPLCMMIVASGRGEFVALEGSGPWVIGRSRSSEVRVDDHSISRKHARVWLDEGQAFVCDLGSANGSRVRGEALGAEQPTAIRVGEPIELGAVLVTLHRRSLLPDRGPEQTGMSVGDISGGAVAESRSMRRVFEVIGRVARSDLSVLLIGETGTGKEVVARSVHRASSRRDGPFVAINCAALPENLVESELFGHVRGAFTGADRDKVGLLEAGHGGTVFLDEVGELSAMAQAKLLRAIETKSVTRVGASDATLVDVRFVAATHRDLPAEVFDESGSSFRSDLFFRLNGVTLRVPPLRERPEDVVALAERFAEGVLFDRAAKDALAAYRWPGNVRQLKNVIQRALILRDPSGPIEAAHLELGAPGAEPSAEADLKDEIQELERQRILEALQQCQWNQTQAAKLLGMPRRTFVNRLDAYNIPRPRKGRKSKS